MRTYAEWKRAGASGPIGLAHYAKAGRMAGALNDHAEELLESFRGHASYGLAERLFRCLTTVEGGRLIRRPARLSRIFAVVGTRTAAAEDDVKQVIRRFASPENSLLVALAAEPGPDTVIDISHESLIRKWGRLQGWVQAEAKSVEWYRDLLRDVERGAAPWKDPDLARAEQLGREDGWNQAWAEQYSPGNPGAFPGVEAFLRQSRILVEADARTQHEEAQREEKRRQNDLLTAQQLARARLRGRRWLTLALGLLSALLVAVVLFIRWKAAQERESSRKFADISRDLSAARAQQEKSAQELSDTRAQLEQGPDHGQKEALERRLALLERGYEQSAKQAREAQDRLADAQKSQAQTSDHAVLVKQIADLQAQLNRSSYPPTLVVLPQYSYVLLDQGPFADGTLGLAVEDLRRQKGADARVYVVNGPAAVGNAKPFRDDSARASPLVERLSRTTACPGRSSDGRVVCFVANHEQTLTKTQALGRLPYRGTDYDVTSVAWTLNAVGGTDVLTLLFTPSRSAPASAR